MKEQLNQLKILLAEISDLGQLAGLLGWDQQVNMPPGAAEARGNQLGTIQKLIHQKSITPEIGQLIEDLSAAAKEIDPDSDEARLIKVAKRDYENAVKVPPEFTEKFAKVTAMAHGAWAEARATNDFSKFQPQLRRNPGSYSQFANFFAPYDHPYDPMLDQFEPGMKTADVKTIFDALRPQQVELIKAIADSPQVDDSFLYQTFDEQKQWDFGVM